MLQLGVPKIYGGGSRCAKHTKHANSRGVWGHAPQENFKKLSVRRLNLEEILVVLAVNQILVLFNTYLTVILG